MANGNDKAFKPLTIFYLKEKVDILVFIPQGESNKFAAFLQPFPRGLTPANLDDGRDVFSKITIRRETILME